MTGTTEDLIRYRLSRAWDTLDDARILSEKEKWNSTINRLYYAAYYAVIAILLKEGYSPTTHNGAKTNFPIKFIKTGLISKDLGKAYSQLFTWIQKGDYDDLFDFSEEKVMPYFEPVKELITLVEKRINARH